MRKYAYLKRPVHGDPAGSVCKIMLCTAEEGIYLFLYTSPDAVLSTADLCYRSMEDLFEEWDSLIDEKGWISMEDPLPDCQQDAFLPIRVKGRENGKPEWGSYEILIDGKWVEYQA